MAGKSVENQLSNLRPYIIAMMEQEGRNFEQCELCPAAIPPGKFDLHHTKYDGATYRDLRIVCRRCNAKAENKLLS